ncbi:Fibrillin-1, partial [Geodia barretti]
DGITCTGNEDNILDCSYDSVSNCDHSEDAGVICGAVCLNGTVRLATEDINEFYQDPDTLDDDYFIKDELARGRVEVCVEGGYGTVCDDYWDSQDASVVCSQLGFSPYGAIGIIGGHFSNASVPVLIGNVRCAANESSLFDCSYETSAHEEVSQCDPNQVAAVACLDSSIGFANCTTGEVRFVDFTDNPEEDSRQGTIQICINNAWGSVCNDHFFDSTDAEVFCDQLVGFSTDGASELQGTDVTTSSAPLFLSSLDCDEMDQSLLYDCSHDEVGLASCDDFGSAVVKCFNIDECAENTDNCSQNCSDTLGSYQCVCYDGYTLDSDQHTCNDIDECATGNNSCHANSQCTNTDGGYECECLPGFDGDGFNCTNIDECAETNRNNCSASANCTDTFGSYECTCSVGYTGDGYLCTDVDECSNATACHQYAHCNNTVGSFICSCMDGYDGDGMTCDDNDECVLGTDLCHEKAACNNTVGSYRCTCIVGYSGDGFNCSDYDECALGIDLCDSHADCTNTIGSHECACRIGYNGDGISCDCGDGEVLLYDGSRLSTNHSNGTVLVCLDNEYGTVCDDWWDPLDATVVCTQLGFSATGSLPVVRSGLGSPPNRSIFLDNVVCTGGEANLTECGYTTITNCDRSEEAGVRCEATCLEGDVRIGVYNFTNFFINIDQYDDYYFIKDEIARGRVEVCTGGSFGTVCGEDWENEDASVVCSQLGFSYYGAIASSTGVFEDDIESTVLYSVECSGNETELLTCSYSLSGLCTEHNAAVICQGEEPECNFIVP